MPKNAWRRRSTSSATSCAACAPAGRRPRWSIACASNTTARRRRSSRWPRSDAPIRSDRHSAVRRERAQGHREGDPLQRSGHVAEQRRQDDPPASAADERRAAQEDGRRAIKKSAEDAKVACRNIRRDGNKHFEQAEKAKEMTEDDRDKGKEEVQALLKQYEEQDRRSGGQEDEGNHGAVRRCRTC